MEEASYPCGLTEFRQEPFTIMPEWRMAYIMAERNGFDQILIKAKETTYCSCHLGNQLNMKHPVCYMIIPDQIKNLGLVNVPCVSHGMKYTVNIQ